MLRILSMLLVVLILVIGCTSSPAIKKDAVMPPIISADKPPQIVLGSKYYYKHTNAVTGQSFSIVTRVKSNVNWMGTSAYIIELNKEDQAKGFTVSGYTVVDANLNRLANMDAQGRIIHILVGQSTVTTAQGTTPLPPAIIVYDWPLKVGKTFSTTYEFLNKSDDKTYKISDQVKVVDKVSLKSSLGSVITYKIYRTTPGLIETRYYSPELGTDVKQDITNTLENSAGVGVFVIELVGYSIPGVGTKGEKF
jgi:hypothetical protein